MTNNWVDIKNADVILVMGGNPADNHPCGFKWAIEAKKTRNAKIICVDPRFNRTAAVSDLMSRFARERTSPSWAGVINHVLANNRIQREYVANYTNAPFIVKEGFRLPAITKACSPASTRKNALTTNRHGAMNSARTATPGLI